MLINFLNVKTNKKTTQAWWYMSVTPIKQEASIHPCRTAQGKKLEPLSEK
jgi:hypothetical protein